MISKIYIVLGIICLLFGAIGWGGQVISGINYPLAQRLGLQEKSAGTDPLQSGNRDMTIEIKSK